MKPTTTAFDSGPVSGLDPVVAPLESPLRPKKLQMRVSGSRLGSVVRPVPTAEELASGMASGVAVAGAVAAPRFGMRVHRSPIAPIARGPISPDDYATADDYE